MIKRTALTFGICIAVSSGAIAHQISLDGDIEIDPDSPGYVNVGGQALRTGDGDCMRASGWSEDSQNNACEGIEETAEVPEEVEEEVAEAAPEPPPKPVKSRIETMDMSEMALFNFDSAVLSDAGIAAVDGLLAQMSEYKGVTSITVTGHTDSTGDADYNMGLSEERAAAVAAILKESYPDASMSIVGKGESEPAASNDTKEGREMNRRVQIDLTATRMTFE